MSKRITSALVATALLASPAFAGEQETIKGAVQQPLRDLSIVKEKTPEALQTAAKGAYDNVDPKNCDLMREEIKALDEALGPDLNDVDVGGKDGSIVTDAVKSAVRLPFAGVVRRMTGAHKRQQAHDQAVIAGVARRGYLKGAINACAAPEPAAPPPVIIRTEARPAAAPPPVIAAPAPRPLPAPRTVQVQQPAPAAAPRGTLEAQAQEAIASADPAAVTRKTVVVATP